MSLPYSISKAIDWSKRIPPGSVLVAVNESGGVDLYSHGPSVRLNDAAGWALVRDKSWIRTALEKALAQARS